MHDERARDEGYARREYEVAQRLVLDVVVEHRLGHERAGRAEEDGVTVGRRFGDLSGTDSPSRAAAVLDDHGLSQHFSQSGSDDPRRDVYVSTGDERDDDRIGWMVALAIGDCGCK